MDPAKNKSSKYRLVKHAYSTRLKSSNQAKMSAYDSISAEARNTEQQTKCQVTKFVLNVKGPLIKGTQANFVR